MTKPLRTAMPERAINPTSAEIDRGKSFIQSARIHPVKASGTPVNIIKASLIEPKVITNKVKIINNVAGTTIEIR